jgi:hypothetical protein
MTDYHEPIHHVMDRDGSLGLMNVIYAMACENRDTARDFIKTHSNLTDADIDDFYAALDSNDPDEQESLGILCRAELLRTHAEILNAWHQVWHRRWYLSATPNDPALVGPMVEKELTMPDINDAKYRTDYGGGYLDGVASALGWVTGQEWAMLDI